MAPQVGQQFAGYTVLRVLGAGGMGTVFLATHPRLTRDDALKVLPAEFSDDAEYRARFAREADLAAGLSHPHIVGVQDRGEHDGQLWISMDYVAGADVARMLEDRYRGGMPVDEVAPIIVAVASALDYAHHRGLLHRDVKPANILLSDPDGQGRRAYLADFGIARRIDDAAGLTATNKALGTVTYAAPEQLRGDPVDGRADQYALACTAFHMLTGEPPYPDTNPTVVITQHVFAPPPSIGARRPELASLDPVFIRAMAKEPLDRFASCGEFADQLRRYPDSGSWTNAPVFSATAPAMPPQAMPPPAIPPPAMLAPGVAAPRVRRKRAGVLVAALVGIALLIGGGVFAGIKLTQRQNPGNVATPTASAATTASTTTTTAVPMTPGPLNGTYRAMFGAATDLDGNGKGPGPAMGDYSIGSACGGNGCVATATHLGSSSGFAVNLVFDEIGDHWLAVAIVSDECRSVPSEFWHVFTVQLRPDGTLTGELTRTSANTCRDKRPVTFTRTGDLDINTVADPARLPPRVVSPAEALHGRYDTLRIYPNQNPGPPAASSVATTCLRTGERCMSYFHSRAGDSPLVFSNGVWVLDDAADYQCPAGGTLHFSVNAQFALPQPLQDPIASLSGHGHQEQTGACSISTDFEQTFTRTGD